MAVDPRSETYRRRLYRRYLWIALIPFGFFVVLGGAAILLSQSTVLLELTSLKERSLRQVADNLELWFAEADSIALGLSTDPELSRGAEYILKTGIPSHEDLKLSRSLQSLLASAVNSRLYLYSVTVTMDSSSGLILTSNEGLLRSDQYADADWTEGASLHASEISPWIRLRSYHPLPNFPLSLPLLSFYRNMLGTGSLEKRGLLAVNIDIRKLDSLLEKEAEGAGGNYVLVDRQTGKSIAGMRLGDQGAEVASSLLAGLDDPPSSQGLRRFSLEGKDYYVASLSSDRFPFAYFLLSPAEELTRIPRKVLWTGGLFAALSMAVGGLLAAALARRNFRLLGGILDIVEAAGRGEPLPAFRSSRNEAFDYVSLAVLKTFVEHDYYKIRLSERELRQRTLELTALQAQMNPHFLFNTLTTISFKAMQLTGGRNEVSDMVKELSEMLAYSLTDAGRPSTVGAELAHCRSYVEIQRRRFGEELRCEWAVEPGLEAVPCIKLLLQPLVENAFEHGFSKARLNGLVRVSGTFEGEGRVRLTVEDDGAGMRPERLAELRRLMEAEVEGSAHVGLVNTARRLGLAYRGAASCEVESSPGVGTRVILRFPDKFPEGGGELSPLPRET